MSFQQPASSIIRQYHFRGKTYTFPVESIMAPASGGGQLSIIVTDGYTLMTSLNELPQHQHTFDYIEQSDGSWLVRGTITLVVTASALLSGTVTLCDPMGETLRMTISAEPTLFINESPIFFDNTKPGKSTAALLAIRQQGAITPVKLRLDPSNVFTVADARMGFITTSGLTLTPSFEGANVLINYTPSKPGHHSARLVVTTPYDTKIIPLLGQTGGLQSWLPNLPKLSVPTLLPKLNPSLSLPALRRSHLLGALFLVVVVGLIWGSYGLLSRSETTIDLAVLAKQAVPVAQAFAFSTNPEPKQVSRPVQDEFPRRDEPESEQPELNAVVQTTVSQPDGDKQVPRVNPSPVHLTTPKLATQAKSDLMAHSRPEPMFQPKPSVISVEKESDLEKELNTPIYHKN